MKKVIYSIFLIVMMSSFANASSNSLVINKEAVGERGVSFIKSIDDQISGYVRAFRRGSQVDFDALKLVMFMNQTANLEKKLDILINETRKTNQLLSLQMKSSNKIINIMSQVKSAAKPLMEKGE